MARKIRQWQDFAIPETIAPPDRRCVVLYIPDEKTHIANFWGNLDRLALWWNWEKEPTHSGTLAAQVWRTVIEQGRLDWLLGKCGDDCPDCEECPEPSPPTGGSGGAAVGQLGLTLEECEEIIMGISLRGLLKNIDGKLHFAGSGCDDWCPVPEEGEATVPSVQSALNAGLQGFDDWVTAGSPPVQDIEEVSHDKFEIYTTDDSLKCAKASAIVEHIWQSIAGWKEVMDNMPSTVRTSTGVGTVLASVFPGVAYVLGMVSKVLVLLSSVPSATVAGQLQTDYDKTALKHDLLCDLVPRMAAPGLLAGVLRTNRMTDADIKIAFERFEAIVSPHANTRALLGFFTIGDWKAATASRMITEECGCEEYLPHGYSPPLPEGQMRYDFKEFGYAAGGFAYPADNTPYEAILAGGTRGEMFGLNPGTELVDTAGGIYTGFMQAIFEFTSPVSISEIKMLFTFPNGTPGDTLNWSNMLFTTDGDGLWKYGAGWGNINDFPEVRTIGGNITAFSVGAHAAHNGAFRRAVLTSVLVSGTYLGEPFIDLPPGQIFDTT